MRKIIFLEINELPFQVIDYFIKKMPNSCLAIHYPMMQKIRTITEDIENLSPWVTWSSLHRGVFSKKHQIFHLGQKHTWVDREYPSFWEILIKNNISVGLFGLMNSYPPPSNMEKYHFYIPDVFAQTPICHPNYVNAFQAFNLFMSRKSKRNVNTALPLKLLMQFLYTSPQLGVSPHTFIQLVNQILLEKRYKHLTSRRRIYQSVISFDIFYKLLKIKKPYFVSYFTNHIASTMHRYWGATFPEDYSHKVFDDKWIKKYKNEILFSMLIFDNFLKKILSFINKNKEYRLFIGSSMGQNAVKTQNIKTELTGVNMKKLLSFLGLPSNTYQELPAMHPQCNFQVNDEKVYDVEKKLNNIIIDDKKLLFSRINNFFSLTFGQKDLKKDSIFFENREIKMKSIGLENKKVDEKAVATAYHVPEGVFLMYDALQRKLSPVEEKTLPITEIYSIILKNYNINI